MNKELKPRILVVDDEESMRQFLVIMLKKEGFHVFSAKDARDALSLMDKEVFDLVVTDMAMPGMTGLELLKKIKSLSADTAVIVITAYGTTESAIEAMKSGAFDYISKPFNNEAIKLTIFKCLQTRLLERENLMLKRQMKMENRFGNLIGSSDAMKEVFELIQVVRNNRSNVIITGESGTGKEIVAREIHFGGDLADQPFVTVNCGAIPENLMESELFGHMRGAFTGAVSNRRGLFRSANGGTIFLDEIGELPVQMQVKLLRVIQTKIVRPVGSAEDFSIDVRIIAATNQDLEQAVKKGQFREDLYFRLNVIHIRVPALKDRSEDIPSLTHYFVTKISKELGKKVLKVNQETLDLLQQYSFPGNIRELENILERGIALEKSPILLPESLPDYLRGYGGSVRDDGSDPKGKSQISLPPEGIDLEKEMDALERHFLEESLKSAKGVKTKAAKLLKLTFRSFRYRLEKHHLD